MVWPSGADIALYPLSVADHGEGELEFNAATKLQDAQGNRIPTSVMKSVEISSRDIDGHEVLLKEIVIFSSKGDQPILVMEDSWNMAGESMVESKHWGMVT